MKYGKVYIDLGIEEGEMIVMVHEYIVICTIRLVWKV